MPTSILINQASLIVLGGLLAWAAVHDARTFTIPNWLSVSVAALFMVYAVSAPASVSWAGSVIAGLLLFLGGLALFSTNLMGGGDVKLMAALGLWSGLNAIMDFLIVTSLAGGVLALVIGSRHWLSRQTVSAPAAGHDDEPAPIQATALPYGIAIACGGLFVAARLFVGP